MIDKQLKREKGTIKSVIYDAIVILGAAVSVISIIYIGYVAVKNTIYGPPINITEPSNIWITIAVLSITGILFIILIFINIFPMRKDEH